MNSNGANNINKTNGINYYIFGYFHGKSGENYLFGHPNR